MSNFTAKIARNTHVPMMLSTRAFLASADALYVPNGTEVERVGFFETALEIASRCCAVGELKMGAGLWNLVSSILQ
jgi:hypothetical protein